METGAQELTDRQRVILEYVVEDYVAAGQPVGSKALASRRSMRVSASTVRYELAELEERGLLSHPHTSAGRVPTDLGYRVYVDRLLSALEPRPAELQLDLSGARREVDVALQATTDALAHVTHLLALVTAPPLRATVVRRAEVLMLQPSTVVCVVITSTGDVSKHVATFDAPVDPGLADWAREYLNEQVAGLALGARLLRNRFGDPGLSPREREFLAALEPAFTELVERGERAVYVGGTASVMGEFPADDIGAFRNLLEALERRAALLELTRAALVNRKPFVRVGSELDDPAFVRVSLVGAPYGLARRNLGTVSLIGPTRMDYGRAIGAVRAAAIELSRFVEGVYDE
ncbi:MAG: heat-inducible transcription repressor HrcA [Thermoleophilia bacterium]|nr:heat-inducible transcription repressor HrcA [Thermoleophilia bacterium]